MAQDENGSGSESNSPAGTIQFNYIKSNHFRVVRADGVVGGITPGAAIQMSFYSERQPVPQVQVFRLDEQGALAGEDEDQRVVRPGLVREVEMMVHLDLGVARAISNWLAKRIADAESQIDRLKSASQTESPRPSKG